jgi:hypothetical protein
MPNIYYVVSSKSVAIKESRRLFEAGFPYPKERSSNIQWNEVLRSLPLPGEKIRVFPNEKLALGYSEHCSTQKTDQYRKFLVFKISIEGEVIFNEQLENFNYIFKTSLGPQEINGYGQTIQKINFKYDLQDKDGNLYQGDPFIMIDVDDISLLECINSPIEVDFKEKIEEIDNLERGNNRECSIF